MGSEHPQALVLQGLTTPAVLRAQGWRDLGLIFVLSSFGAWLGLRKVFEVALR